MRLFLFDGHKSVPRKWMTAKIVIFLTSAFFLLTVNQSKAQTVNFSAKNASLKSAFDAIKEQAGYVFFYDVNLLSKAKPVTVELKNVSIEKALNEIFKGQPFKWVMANKTITITPKVEEVTKANLDSTKNPQFVVMDIQGRVIEENGQPLAYAAITILINGKKAGGSLTDANGFFILKQVDIRSVLIINSLSTVPFQVALSGKSNLGDIIVKTKITETEPVVITGMQNRKKSVLVGSVTQVTAKDLENTGITTFEKGLSGKMPGVYVRSVSGRPGETGQIIIRGVNSLTGNVEPLYVLDGMPLQPGEITGGVNSLITNGIGNIPPENIESITILKDATASSIYGSRAANGVIVINTKNGQIGNDYVNYSGKFGITSMPVNKFNFMNSAEKIEFEKTLIDDFYPAYENGGRVVQLNNLLVNGAITKANYDAQIDALSKTNTNWVDQLYRNANSQSHNISFSGGNTKTTYFVSFNYQNSQGALIQNRFQTGGLNMKLSRFINKKLLVKMNVYSTIKKNEEGQAGMDPFKYAVFANTYEKPFNADGTYASDMTYRSIPYTVGSNSALYYSNFNIIRELRENKLSTNYANVRAQFSLEYDFLRHFKYTGSIVGNYSSQQDKDESFGDTYRSWVNNWLNSSSTGGLGVLPEHNRGFMQQSSGRSLDYTVRNTIEYNNTFGGKHFVQGFFANEIGAASNEQFKNFSPIYLQQYGITGYPSWDLVPDNRFQLLNLSRLGSTSERQNRNVSFIGSASYSYDNKYVFNGNIRSDGVDIIGSQNQFSPLWSVGTKWNAHNENFLQKAEFINRLVLSVGYGYRGSINRSVYPFHTYTLGTLVYANSPLASAFSYGNPVIKWEKKRETNIGLELSMFKSRVNTEFRYFNETVVDLLDNAITPPSTGRPSAIINNGSLSNRGIEVSVRVEVIKNAKWLWEIGGNFTKVTNNLQNVYEKVTPSSASLTTRNIQSYPVNGWFGYNFSHVDPLTGDMMVFARKINNKQEGNQIVTSYTDELVNLNKIALADLTTKYTTYFLGQRDPKFYGGFNSRLTYKSFEMTAYFVFAGGNKIISFNDRREGPSGAVGDISASRTNRLKENLYRWRQGGDITDIPRYSYNASPYTSFLISKDIEDGSYIKCTELSLSWRAPKSILNSLGMKTLKVTLVGANLFTLSNYSGIDPETQTPFSYPNTKNFALSLNVGL